MVRRKPRTPHPTCPSSFATAPLHLPDTAESSPDRSDRAASGSFGHPPRFGAVESRTRLNPELKLNLEALTAIRDSAAHYITASPVLAKQVLEVATASVKNFVLVAKSWFGIDFSDSLSLVLPLSFVGAPQSIEAVVVTHGEQRLLAYLQSLATNEPDKNSPFDIAVRVQVKFERSKLSTATKVQVTKDPDAVKVFLTEEDMRRPLPTRGLAHF